MTNKVKVSLTVKIFGVTALLLVLVCVATVGFIAWYMPKDYTSLLGEVFDRRLEILAEELIQVPPEESFTLLDQFAAENHVALDLFDPGGELLYYNDQLVEEAVYDGLFVGTTSGIYLKEEDALYSVTMVEDLSGDSVVAMTGSSNGNMTAYEHSVLFQGSEDYYHLFITARLYQVNQAMEALQRVFPWLALVILGISLIGSFFYARYITRPIVRISGISRKLADLDFSWRCEEKRQDEIGVLAGSLNKLAERLDTALGELRDANDQLLDDITREREQERGRLAFFAAVSHELKTPITVIKGQLEGMIGQVGSYRDRDKYLPRCLQVAQNLEHMVGEILTISRMESSGFAVHREDIDFSALAGEVLALHRDALAEKSLTLSADIAENMRADADPLLLRRVLDNLVSNAVKYTPAGESVYVRATSTQEGPAFSILNTGTSLPEDSLSRIYEAFYRVEKSRSRESGGSGLGLYLTRMILDLHGVEYEIENTAAGVQFRFQLKNQ